MQDFLIITGMILKTLPVGEYDKRIVILTKERGKISAFAKNARRPNNSLAAATNPFSFGEFKLYVGTTSYNVLEANISNYFGPLREDFEGVYYGMYFLEIVDYYTRENNDERDMLKLIYQSLRAVLVESIPNELIRCVFEIKSMVINGEFPGIHQNHSLAESTVYTIQYIETSSIEKLYTFSVTEEVLVELTHVCKRFCKQVFDRKFHSLAILESLPK